MRLLQLTAVAVTLVASPAWAVKLDSFELRLMVYDQDGQGYQSKAGPLGGPGSESATVVEPLLHAVVRTDAWTHDVALLVDVVSAASPDAIDTVSSASRVNEAGGLDVTSTYAPASQPHRFSLRYGFHVEEPLRSFFLGVGDTLRLAEDNTILSASLLGTYDLFNRYTFDGGRWGYAHRGTLSGNLSMSQILSPTTRVELGYGYTLQLGTLETTYNSVPVEGPRRGQERFPSHRNRHALSVRLSQMVPPTGTTLKLGYRYYLDDFGLDAHTVQAHAYQYLVPWLYVRLGYRWYEQTSVDFYGEMFTDADLTPRTADSDLAAFTAHEVSGKLVLLAERSPFTWLRRSLFDLSVLHYWRSNGLTATAVMFAWGYRL